MKKNITITLLCLSYFGNTANASDILSTDTVLVKEYTHNKIQKPSWIPIVLGDVITFIPGGFMSVDVLPSKIFLLDTKKGIATHRENKQVWQNNNIGHAERREAITRCNNLDFAGITNWRLPTSLESKYFHSQMNLQGDQPKQAFDRCVAEVTSDGYIRTKKGADTYGGKPGDSISFSGGANIRCVSGTTTTTDTSTPETDNTLQTTKQAYLDAINYVRAHEQNCGKYGIKPAVGVLKWNDLLYKAALEHSNDLAKTDTFSHDGSGKASDITAKNKQLGRGSKVGERIEYNGYTNWRSYGENIAAGTSMDQAQEAINVWVASDGHCKNLMNPNFTEVGMAQVYNQDSHYLHYWTQDFGKR